MSTSDLTADAGAEGAVTLRFTTKRGTNQFHGSGFWEAYNSAFNANSFQNDAVSAAGSYRLGEEAALSHAMISVETSVVRF